MAQDDRRTGSTARSRLIARFAIGLVAFAATGPVAAAQPPQPLEAPQVATGGPATEGRPGSCRDLLESARACLSAYESVADDTGASATDRAPLARAADLAGETLRALTATSGPVAASCAPLRSEAYVLLAWAEGVRARESWLWNKIAPARRSFAALRAAVAEKSADVAAWSAYGVALFGIHESWFSGAAERALDIDLRTEMLRVLEALGTPAETLQSLTVTRLLTEALMDDAPLPPPLSALHAHARERIAELRRLDTAAAIDLDRALGKVQRLLDGQRAEGVS